MNTTNSVLSLDLGAGSLKLAEFRTDEAGALCLVRYVLQPHRPGACFPAVEPGLTASLRDALALPFGGAKRASVCAPASEVFCKFLRLPAVDRARLGQVVGFEARQHLPLPLEDLTWDYQVLDPAEPGQCRVLLTAIRSSTAEEWVGAAEDAGVRVDLLDAAPVALANAFRYNYPELSGCSLVLEIGARSTTVLLLDEGRLFFRTINLGGSTLTAEFAAEARLRPTEAERKKLAEDMVGLGGAYEDPVDPDRAILAKVARQFMTRLHAQVAQTIQFHRAQQGGAPPQRMYLAGGGSGLPYTPQFFAEKLDLPVEYFNPFRRVRLDPSIPLEALARAAPALGTSVGVALRRSLHLPLEVNLMPIQVLQRRQRRRVGLFAAATAVSLAVAFLTAGWFYQELAAEKRRTFEAKQRLVERLQQREQRFQAALAERGRSARAAEQYTRWMAGRFDWADLLLNLRQQLETTESLTSNERIRSGIWIETMAPDLPEDPAVESTSPIPLMDPRFWRRYSRSAQSMPSARGAADPPTGPAWTDGASTTQAHAPVTNKLNSITLTCRAVSWRRVSPTADSELAYAFLRQLQASPLAATGPEGTRLLGLMQQDEASGTFTFNARLVLKKPIDWEL